MTDTPHGVHDYTEDPHNADILISVNGELKQREDATVSVFDSGYILGDGVWEGMRIHKGGVAFLPEHLRRLYADAKTINMDIGMSPDALTAQLFDCLKANKMDEGVHIRLMVTRGIKKAPYQGPRFTIGSSTIVIIPEYKAPVDDVVARGQKLFTERHWTYTRRSQNFEFVPT
ncbi:MAG: aminotransferase class IV [Hyphomonadaceae bacterium]